MCASSARTTSASPLPTTAALAHADGRYVLLLNPDIEIVAGTFEELLDVLEAQREIGVASVVQRAPDGGLQHSIRSFPSPLARVRRGDRGALAGRRCDSGARRSLAARSTETEQAVDWVVGAFLIARARGRSSRSGDSTSASFSTPRRSTGATASTQAGWKVAPPAVDDRHPSHRLHTPPRPVRAAQLREATVRAEALRPAARLGDPRAAGAAPRAARRCALRSSAG